MIAAFSVAFVLLVSCSSAIQVKEIAREVNLRGFVTRIEEKFIFESRTDVADICFTKEHMDNASLVHCYTKDENMRLATEETAVKGQPQDVKCLKVYMIHPSQALTCQLSTGHQLKPYPALIGQNDDQRALYEGTVNSISPYTVKSQKTVIMFPSATIESYSKPAGITARQDGKKIVYSGISDTKPFSITPLKLHYLTNKPFFHIKNLEREITVSHWGRVFISETYDIRHAGAAVTGAFSRWDVTSVFLTKKSASHSPIMHGFTTYLHKDAKQVLLTDGLGHLLKTNSGMQNGVLYVALIPRYPLLGGWETHFKLRYTLPLGAVAARERSTGRYVIDVGHIPLFEEDYFADNVTTHIILPEGSTDVTLKPGALRGSVAHSKTFTYLDTHIGRPTVSLSTLRAAGDDAVSRAQVAYEFSFVYAALEPALLVAAFLALLVSVVFASRLDLTIVKGPSWHAREAALKTQDALRGVRSTVAALDSAALQVASAAASGPLDRRSLLPLEQRHNDLLSFLSVLKQLGSPKASEVAEIASAYNQVIADYQKACSAKNEKPLGSDMRTALRSAQAIKAKALIGI